MAVAVAVAVATIWVFGDQLSRRLGPLETATAANAKVLLAESQTKVASKR